MPVENIYKILRDIGIELITINQSIPLLEKATKIAQRLVEAEEAYGLVLDENGRLQLSCSSTPTPLSIEALRASLEASDCFSDTNCLATDGHLCLRLSQNHLIYLITSACSAKQNEILALFREQTAFQLNGILQHERTADDLHRSQNRCHNLLASLHEGIWAIDAEAMTTFVNPQMATMLGYTVEEMLGKSVFTFMDEEGIKITTENLAQRAQGVKDQYPLTLIDKAGQPVYVLMEASPIQENGRYVGAISGVMDVTERERTFEELRYNEKRFRDLVQTTNNWIWEVDTRGIYTYSSKAVKHLLGYSRKELLGRSSFDFMLPKEAERVGKLLADIIVKNMPFKDFRHDLMHKNGTLVQFSSTGIPIIDSDGERRGYRGINRDITDLVKQEKERALAQRKAELLLAVLRGINQAPTFKAALEVTVRLIGKHTGWIYAEAWSAASKWEGLCCDAYYIDTRYQARLESFASLSTQTAFAYGQGLPGRVWDSQKVVRHEDIQLLSEDKSSRTSAANKAGLKTLLAVPAVTNETTMAVMIFYASAPQEEDGQAMELITRVFSELGTILQQKQSEETLRKLSRAVEQSASSIFITDLDGKIEFVNPAFTQISGYSYADVVGKTPAILRSPYTSHNVHLDLWSRLHQGETWKGEMQNKRKDGSLVWLQSIISPITDQNGNSTHYLCIQNDIVEQMEAQAALQASEARNRAIVQTIPDITFLIDKDGTFIQHYGTQAGLLLAPDEFLTRNVADILPPEIVKKVMDAIETTLRTDKIVQFNYSLFVPDNAGQGQYEARITKASDTSVLALIRDVTAEWQTTEWLRESRRKLARAQEIAHLGSWEWEIPSGKVMWSDEMYRILGYAPQSFAVTYEKFVEAVYPEDVSILQTAIEKTRKTGKIFAVEHRIQRPSGEIRYLNGRGELYSDEDGVPIRLVGAVLDITEQVAARQKLEQATENARLLQLEAERANNAKSLFLTNMSHELRTPLNAILGYTQLFKEDDSLSRQQQHGVDVIHRSGEHLLYMINDMLDLAKIEAGKMALYADECNLPETLTTLVDMISQLAWHKGIRFSYRFAAGLPEVIMIDGFRLRQILLNLLSNAVKFTDNGEVLLEVFPVQTAVLSPNSSHINIRFRVQDSGKGIPSELLETIFAPFEQAGTTRDKIEGTGLGLAISQRLTSLLGGTLKVSSKLGKGSIFWFDLDVGIGRKSEISEENSNHAVPTISGTKGNKTVRLLIVDDIENNRLVLTTYFSTLSGFKIMEATNGEEAVAKAAEFKPHVILMDLRMPVMSGMEAMQLIRSSLPSLEKVVIIAISADAYAHIEAEMIEAGFDGFMVKPVQLTRLFEQIRLFLGDTWDWQYSQNKLAVKTAVMIELPENETAVLIPLPEEETAVLLNLVKIGDIKNLRDRLSTFSQKCAPQYQPTMDKLTEFAREYRIKQIRELLEEL